MTYEEAKKNILNMCCWCNDDTDDTDDTDCIYHEEKRTDLCEKCEFYFALKSIEKQIPKKPFNNDGYVDGQKNGIHYCIECGAFVWSTDSYCNKCGQAIDWSDNE